MILHFTSTMNSFQWCHSSRLAFLHSSPSHNWHRVTLRRINAFPARRQMCSLCVEWSTNHGDCQRELRLIKHWSCREAAVSVCMCLHTGRVQSNKNTDCIWIWSICWGYLIISWSCCHLASWTQCLWSDDWDCWRTLTSLCCSWKQWCVETLLVVTVREFSHWPS